MISIVENIQGKTFEINIDNILKDGFSLDFATEYAKNYINNILKKDDISKFREDKVMIIL